MKSDPYETSILDHHKKIFSGLRKTFAKCKPKTVFYRCYKKYDQNSLNEALQKKISQPELSFEKLFEIFRSTLDAFISKKNQI